jgi:hypothetical protein
MYLLLIIIIMNKPQIIRTTKEVLQILGLKAWPNTLVGWTGAANELVEKNVKLEDQALKDFSFAFQLISDTSTESFIKIAMQLRPFLVDADQRHATRLKEFIEQAIALDLPPSERAKVINRLIASFEAQTKIDRNIFGDLAKIAATTVGMVAVISAAAIGHKHSRSKTNGEIIDKWLQKFKK